MSWLEEQEESQKFHLKELIFFFLLVKSQKQSLHLSSSEDTEMGQV